MTWIGNMIWCEKATTVLQRENSIKSPQKEKITAFCMGTSIAPSAILYTFLDIDKLESSEKSTKHDPKTRRIDLWGEIRRVKYINCSAKKWLMEDMITAYKYLKKTTSEGKAFFSGIHREQLRVRRCDRKARTCIKYQEMFPERELV